MPTASAPSAAIARSTTRFDRRQGVTAVAEQRVGGKPHIAEIEVAGAAAAEPCEIARGEAACALWHQKQAEPARLAIDRIDAGRNDDLPGGVAVEHGGLVAVEAPAVRRLLRGGANIRQIEARLAFRMRERQYQRAVGDLRQQRLLLRFGAAFRDQRCADHDGGEIGLGDEPAAECFHQNADLDGAAAEAAIGLRDRQRQPAEFGELLPEIGAEAERIVGDPAAVIGGIGFLDEAVGTFAQQPLLVAQGEVHLIYFAFFYFTGAAFRTEGCRPAGSTTMPNSCRLCAWQS